MSDHSTVRRVRRKRTDRPVRPYPEFPLQPHGSGYWSKRVRGRLAYFGKWGQRENGKLICLPDGGDWRSALTNYQARIDDLQVGRIPRNRTVDSDGLRLHELFNRFLTSKTRQCEAGELSPRSFMEYHEASDRMVTLFGNPLVDDLRPEDFQKLRATFADKWGPHRVGKFVQLVRSVFKFGQESGLLKTPVLFGPSFKKPSRGVMRRHKAGSDKKLFTAPELRMILAALEGEEVAVTIKSGKQKQAKLQRNLPLRAAVLLALNTGCGNSDVSSLKFSHLDFDSRWLDFPRVKTGLARRVPLWNVTVDALKSAIAVRSQSKCKDDDSCVFLNRNGRRLVQTTKKSHHDSISIQFGRVLRRLGINGRSALGFYSLRHTAATVGLQTGDRDAVRAIMGHVENDVLATYDECGPSDERLLAVVEHVREWLFGINKQ